MTKAQWEEQLKHLEVEVQALRKGLSVLVECGATAAEFCDAEISYQEKVMELNRHSRRYVW